MTHLRIEQNGTGVGTLPNSTVSKLYNIVHSGTLDNTSNLKGGLYVTNCKQSQKQYLETLYPEFSIICTGQYYLDFVDPVVEQICATNWGDGIGITAAQAASVTSFGDTFKDNTQITSFDELQYFTGMTQFNYTYSDNVFTGCTNLTTVDLRNITNNIAQVDDWYTVMYFRQLFKNCSSLTTVKNYNVNWISVDMFRNCSNLQTINLSNIEYILYSGLENCTSLDVTANGLDFTKIKELGNSCLSGCLGVGDVELPLCTTLGRAFFGCNSITSISNCPNITYLEDNGAWNGTYGFFETMFMSSSIDTIDLSTSQVQNVPICIAKCSNLRIVKFPSTVTQMNGHNFNGCSSLQAFVIYATTPPTVDTDGGRVTSIASSSQNCKIYVPDASVSAYQTASTWSANASNIFGISQYATDFPDD